MAILPVVILSVVLTIVGYHYIHIGLRYATWLFIVAYAVFTIGALFNVSLPAHSFDLGGFHLGLFLVQFGAVVSYQLTWAPYVSEYSRYLPEDTPTGTVFWWTYWGSAVGALMMLLGAFILAPDTSLAPVAAVHDTAQKIFHGFGPILLVCSIPGLIAVHRDEHVQRRAVDADHRRHGQAHQADAHRPLARRGLHHRRRARCWRWCCPTTS